MFDCAFLTSRQIGSLQKLRLLLWLYHRAGHEATLQEIEEHLYLGDVVFLERTVIELAATGTIRYQAGRCCLVNTPEIVYCLECLEVTFEDPAARQSLLAAIERLQSIHASRT